MITLNQTIDELRKGLKVYRAFEHAEEVIGTLQAAAQQLQEMRNALADLTPQVDATRAALAAVTDQVEAAKLQATEILSTAKVQAEKLVSDAHDETREVLSDRSNYLKAMEDASAAAVADAKTQVDALGVQQVELAKEVAELEKKAEKARAYLTKLAG